MSGFLIPEFATVRPQLVALGIEWPPSIVGTLSESRTIAAATGEAHLIDVSLRITEWADSGPIHFEVVSDYWALPYSLSFDSDGPKYRADGADATLRTQRGEQLLSEFMTRNGMAVFFTQDALLVPDGHLLKPAWDLPRFERAALEPIDWTGVNIRKESQGPNRDSDSVQFRTLEYLAAETDWDVIVDDDGTGEVADIVCIKHSEQLLEITLVHCKFSHGDSPGARVADVYEVCGQAAKSHKARAEAPLLLAKLIRRERKRQKDKGFSGLVLGSEEQLLELGSVAHLADVSVTVVISQPGLSQAQMSDAQAEVLASTSMYLGETYSSTLRVLCSE